MMTIQYIGTARRRIAGVSGVVKLGDQFDVSNAQGASMAARPHLYRVLVGPTDETPPAAEAAPVTTKKSKKKQTRRKPGRPKMLGIKDVSDDDSSGTA